MDGKWLCNKCHTYGDNPLKCIFCGTTNEENKKEMDDKEIALTNGIHKAIDKLKYPSKVKVWRWLEDNVL